MPTRQIRDFFRTVHDPRTAGARVVDERKDTVLGLGELRDTVPPRLRRDSSSRDAVLILAMSFIPGVVLSVLFGHNETEHLMLAFGPLVVAGPIGLVVTLGLSRGLRRVTLPRQQRTQITTRQLLIEPAEPIHVVSQRADRDEPRDGDGFAEGAA